MMALSLSAQPTSLKVASSFDSLIDEMAERARRLGAPHEYQLKITSGTL